MVQAEAHKIVPTKDAPAMKVAVMEAGASTSLDAIDVSAVMRALEQSGAVVLRGFAVGADNFESLTHLFCDSFHIVGARQELRASQGDGKTTQVHPHNFTILSHTEGAFQPKDRRQPDMCFFMCLMPPECEGGETTLADGAAFLQALPEAMRQRFLQHGVTYEMQWGKERWQPEFAVEDAQALQQWLSARNDVRFSMEGDELHLFYTTAAITRSHWGQQVFATGMLAHLPRITHPRYLDKRVHVKPTNRVYFGDGTELTDEEINTLIDIQDGLAYRHRWQQGDVIVIDNTRCLHGRVMTQRDCPRTLASRFGWLPAQGQKAS